MARAGTMPFHRDLLQLPGSRFCKLNLGDACLGAGCMLAGRGRTSVALRAEPLPRVAARVDDGAEGTVGVQYTLRS